MPGKKNKILGMCILMLIREEKALIRVPQKEADYLNIEAD